MQTSTIGHSAEPMPRAARLRRSDAAQRKRCLVRVVTLSVGSENHAHNA
jgi:hypothetical protein